jgi:hypothetical protein
MGEFKASNFDDRQHDINAIPCRLRALKFDSFQSCPLADSSVDLDIAQYNVENSKKLSLTNMDNFLIYYVFANDILEKPLREEMINHLKKIGVVFSGDDAKLTEQQRENKYKIGKPILDVVVSPIVEESNKFSNSYKKLPVIELSLKVKADVQLIENGSRIVGIIWEDHRYISTMYDKKQFIQTAIESFDELLSNFKVEYEKANPPKDSKKPQFYLYF